MNRRDFLHYTGAASLISTSVILPSTLFAKSRMPLYRDFNSVLRDLIELNNSPVLQIKGLQNLDSESKYYGGVFDSWKIYTPHSSRDLIKTLSISFSQSNSKYYYDKELIESMELAAKYMLKIQHSDVTIDLLSANFHSTPDTGFVVELLCVCYKLLEQSKHADHQWTRIRRGLPQPDGDCVYITGFTPFTKTITIGKKRGLHFK